MGSYIFPLNNKSAFQSGMVETWYELHVFLIYSTRHQILRFCVLWCVFQYFPPGLALSACWRPHLSKVISSWYKLCCASWPTTNALMDPYIYNHWWLHDVYVYIYITYIYIHVIIYHINISSCQFLCIQILVLFWYRYSINSRSGMKCKHLLDS